MPKEDLGSYPLREMCPNTEFFWAVFCCILSECGVLPRKSPYSVRIQEKKNQKTPYLNTFHPVIIISIAIGNSGTLDPFYKEIACQFCYVTF